MTRPRLPNPAASRALLIGVHTYQHLEQLLPVRNNLTGLAATLRDERVWGLPLENVTVLEQPKNRKAVVDGIIDANRRAGDTLLIYYSGHGLTDLRWSEELYLALPTTENLRTDTALPYTEIRRALGQNGVLRKQLVVVLDCCRSGRALREEVADNTRFADLAADVLQDDLPEQPFVAGHAVLTATHSRQAAMAPPGATYSTFTRALLDVLNKGLAGKPEVLDVESVYAALRDGAAPGSARPQLRSRGEPAALGIARNCSPQRGPGPPGPRPSGPPPPPQRTGVPARMPELVREYLQRQPWTPLDLVAPAAPESWTVRRARRRHALGPFEELIAVRGDHRLAVTSMGLRHAGKDGDLLIRWHELSQYRFGYVVKNAGGWMGVPDVVGAPADTYALTVRGPRAWVSKPIPSSVPSTLAEQLNEIVRLSEG
ncbi:caspase domain-containing protein [Streptomyces sp. NPDC059496]|uniref:caspase family protein n=1 Tax=Streptomyces sp. NPDC059496 TaxID=3346851 RepID=UPI0036830ADE